jgi:hypothetical protein
MKKYLYNFVFATLILMSTPVVYATNEAYYINRNNIEMTEKEYNNLVTLGFTEKHISGMDQEEFLANKDLEGTLLNTSKRYIKTTTTMRNGIRITTSKEITYEEAMEEVLLHSQKDPIRGPYGNYYDGMSGTYVFEMTTNITAIGNDYMRFMNNAEWLTMPTDRYNDIIGIGMESNKVQFATGIIFREEWVTTSGLHDNTQVCAPKYVSTGGLAAFKLPNASIQSLDISLYFNVMKKANVGTITSLYAVGDYAHAICNVSTDNLMSHISISDSAGIMVDATYSSCYLHNQEAVASFIGTW